MSRLNFDLNSLAQETLELTRNLRSKENFDGEEDAFDFSFQEMEFDFEGNEEEVEAEPEVEDIPDTPGVLFYLEKGISTFCIRGIVSDDLSWDYDALKRNDPQLITALRLKDDWEIDQIGFFPTLNMELAETICDVMVNRRFPKQEAVLCNLSDPGFSWWMEVGEKSLNIFFQSHGIERDSSLIQLGPLGDPFVSFKRFSRCQGILKNLFPLNEFSATEKSFTLSTTTANLDFLDFQKIFVNGVFEFEDIIQGVGGEEQTFFLYLRELANLRSFWLVIQDLL